MVVHDGNQCCAWNQEASCSGQLGLSPAGPSQIRRSWGMRSWVTESLLRQSLQEAHSWEAPLCPTCKPRASSQREFPERAAAAAATSQRRVDGAEGRDAKGSRWGADNVYCTYENKRKPQSENPGTSVVVQ